MHFIVDSYLFCLFIDFNMISAFKGYSNMNGLIGFITGMNDSFEVCIMDLDTETVKSTFKYPIKNGKEFIDQLSTSTCNIFKAFIVQLFAKNSEQSCDLCKELKDRFRELKIPAYFISQEIYLFTSLLIDAKIDVNHDDIIFVIVGGFSGINLIPELLVGELHFTSDGYELRNQRKLSSLNPKENHKILFQQICGSTSPKKVIVSSASFSKIPFYKIFKPKLLILLDLEKSSRDKFMLETYKWISDKSYVKFHIIPTCINSVRVFEEYGSEKHVLDILKIEKNEPLPITKTAIFPKSVPSISTEFKNRFEKHGYSRSFPKECHSIKFIITFDESGFVEESQIELLIKEEIEDLPSKMDAILKSKIPFIGFYDNSSVIGVYSNEGYKFLDEWNGMFGNDCFISFDQKRLKFGQNAVDSLKIKNTFVVFDLIKIMSMPSEDIKIEKRWGFTFTSDSENPVLLEFDNFDGTKKHSSPSFLLAIYLRQHLKVIAAKIGEKPKQIALWINGEDFVEVELKRIKESLKESCRLLKIDVFFVDIEGEKVDFIKYCPKERL